MESGIEDLRALVREQDERIRVLEARACERSRRETAAASADPTRRQLFRLAGAAAAGGVAATVASGVLAPSPVGAADGDSVVLGQENESDATTIVRGSGAEPVFAVLEGESPAPPNLGVLQVMADGNHQWGIGSFVRSAPDDLGPDEFPFGVVGLVNGDVDGVGVGGDGTFGGAFRGSRAHLVLVPGETRDDSKGHRVGEYFQDPSSVWACVADGAPGTWRKVAGTATAGQLHLLSSPLRIYDSRAGKAPLDVEKGVLANEAERVIDAKHGGAVPAGANGGTPSAALVNLTITDTTSSGGFLALFANGAAWPGHSSINWDAIGCATANTTVVALDDEGRFTVRASPGGGTDFVIDVLGYWL